MRRHRTLWLALPLLLASCEAFTANDGPRLEYTPVVLRGYPATGQVTFSTIVRNEGDRPVHVFASQCAVGYRIVARNGGEIFQVDPRLSTCGLMIGYIDRVLNPGETVQISSHPHDLPTTVPTGVYDLTILVYHDGRYRELPVGEFALP